MKPVNYIIFSIKVNLVEQTKLTLLCGEEKRHVTGIKDKIGSSIPLGGLCIKRCLYIHQLLQHQQNEQDYVHRGGIEQIYIHEQGRLRRQGTCLHGRRTTSISLLAKMAQRLTAEAASHRIHQCHTTHVGRLSNTSSSSRKCSSKWNDNYKYVLINYNGAKIEILQGYIQRDSKMDMWLPCPGLYLSSPSSSSSSSSFLLR